MKPSQVSQSLAVLLDSRQPCMLWGKPGVGKSQVVAQLAVSRGLQLRDIRAVQHSEVDFSGLPYVVDGVMYRSQPSAAILPRDGAGILFLDELPAAPQLVQAALYQLVLDRRLGDYVLPDGWTVIAAGNYETDGAVSNKMGTALRSRFVHLDMETDIEDWSKWALTHNVNDIVRAFVRSFPHLLHVFDKTARSFACPRTYEFAGRILDREASLDIEHGLLTGTLGEGTAIELSAFARLYRSLAATSLDAILMSPTTAPVPSDNAAAMYAISCGLARRANPKTIGRIVQYFDRCPMEYSVFGVKSAVQTEPSLQNCSDFVNWAIKHADVIF